MTPLLSIITVNFNNKAGLEKTIASVIGQTTGSCEYLIIDGGSTDGSADVINKHKAKLAYWVSEKDGGIYNAMNKGIQKASGHYLMFLNSGDCLSHKTAIQECCDAVSEKNIVDILYGDVVVNDKSAKQVRWRYPDKLNLAFFKASTLNHQATLIKADLFQQIGPYSERHGMAADYLFFLQCVLNNKRFKHINSILVDYDTAGISAAQNFSGYVREMQHIWAEQVPLWAQAIVDENEHLKHATGPRVVKGAIALNQILKKISGKKEQ